MPITLPSIPLAAPVIIATLSLSLWLIFFIHY
jgi:hypothetical protein